jgi:hypothetical protein
MNLNFLEIPAIAAANDNNQDWVEDLELKYGGIDVSDYVISLTPKTAAYLGLEANWISVGYFDYLLDGHVADEDEEASLRLIALRDAYFGPGQE